MNSVYEIVTNRILEEMSKGIVPWQKPWHGANDLAISYDTRRPYSLLNQMLLGRPGEWLTFNQIKALGGSIKKGAKASFVTFFKAYPKKADEPVIEPVEGDESEEETKIKMSFVLRYYNVFHIDDCEGIKSKISEAPVAIVEPIQAAEDVIGEYLSRETTLSFTAKKSNRAYYSPISDAVVVPMISQYDNAEEYYSTTFHELVHSTGHHTRLDRKNGMVSHFGNEDYSKEELIAEIGSAMICGVLGFDCKKTFKNSVAYLQNWIQVLKNDTRMIVYASSGAEKAAKYILNAE